MAAWRRRHTCGRHAPPIDLGWRREALPPPVGGKTRRQPKSIGGAWRQTLRAGRHSRPIDLGWRRKALPTPVGGETRRQPKS